jgi:hypothetical protein
VQSKISADACDLAGLDRAALVEKAMRIAANLRAELRIEVPARPRRLSA